MTWDSDYLTKPCDWDQNKEFKNVESVSFLLKCCTSAECINNYCLHGYFYIYIKHDD